MSIRLHKKYGVNPTMTNCFYCNEPDAILLPGAATKQFKDAGLASEDGEMKHNIGVVDMTPCSKCKGYMDQGIILISIKDDTTAGDMHKQRLPNPHRTGGWCVVKSEAVKRFMSEGDMLDFTLKHRFAFITDEAWDNLGLPRHDIEEGSNG